MRTLRLSELTTADLKSIARVRTRDFTESVWKNIDQMALSQAETLLLQDLVRRLQQDDTTIMNEATLWSRAIYPLLMLAEQPYVRAWAQVALRAQYPHVELLGVADGVLGKNIIDLIEESYYVVVVEAKRGLEAQDPRIQLYGQLLAAARLNWENDPQPVQEVYGCYTIIDTWKFVRAVVRGVDSDMPEMTLELSREYSQKAEAETIVKILKTMVAERASYHQEPRV